MKKNENKTEPLEITDWSQIKRGKNAPKPTLQVTLTIEGEPDKVLAWCKKAGVTFEKDSDKLQIVVHP